MGVASRGFGDEGSDDAGPPYSLMEHAPLAAFVNGVLAALNELRHCAPINLKEILAKELQHALQSVSESLLRYNATRMLRENESNLFIALCRAFIEVACPYCIRCFGRCYSGPNVIQSSDFLENLRRFVFTTTFSMLQNNGDNNITENQRGISTNSHSAIIDGRVSSDGIDKNSDIGALENGSKEANNGS